MKNNMENDSYKCNENIYVEAFKNALTTKANLMKRKLVDDPLCPICGVVVETTGHIL
jgi:hypothetical protein